MTLEDLGSFMLFIYLAVTIALPFFVFFTMRNTQRAAQQLNEIRVLMQELNLNQDENLGRIIHELKIQNAEGDSHV